MVGVVGTFSLPVTCVIPRADSCTIICAVRQRHRYKFGEYPVMAGDCGDEIPSKSKPQSAGVTSSTSFVNFLINHSLQTSSFRFASFFREFRERSRNSSSVLTSLLPNLSTPHHSSSPVLTIFVATSFSS